MSSLVYHSILYGGVDARGAGPRVHARMEVAVCSRGHGLMIVAVEVLEEFLPAHLLVEAAAAAVDDLAERHAELAVELRVDQRVQHRRRVAEPE